MFWNEQIIAELGFAAELLQTYHSGVTVSLLPNSPPQCSAMGAVPQTGMTLEYIALKFPFGAILPMLHGDDQLPTWSNQASVQFSNDMFSGQGRNWTDTHRIGTMSAVAFNAWMNYPVQFIDTHPGYELFDVWTNAVDAENQFIDASICTTFSVGALRNAYVSSGDVDFSESSSTVLYRNFVPMITEKEPTLVDTTDLRQLQQLNAFYAIVSDLARRKIHNMVSFVEELTRELSGRAFYVYNTKNNTYFKVELSSPYIGIVGMYQPMQLQWQEVSVPSCPLTISIHNKNNSNNNDGKGKTEGEVSMVILIISCLLSACFGGVVFAVVLMLQRGRKKKRSEEELGLNQGLLYR